MIKTLGAYVKEFKQCINCDTVLHDSGSFDGDDDSLSDGFHY